MSIAEPGLWLPAGCSVPVIEMNGTRLLSVECDGLDADALMDEAFRANLLRELRHYGGVLVRGARPAGAAGFNARAASFGRPLLSYEFGSTPRSHVEQGVYSSTEYPASQWIDQHNEQSYTLKWPAWIWFYCDVAAAQGGATPVADSREVYRRLDPALRRLFAQKQVMYVRNYGTGLDLPWQQVFNTDRRDVVESFCAENRIGYEWGDDGESLRTKQVCQTELRHPDTGETVWFNQAHLFHVSSLPPELRESLLDAFPEEELPRHACFGDGTPIDEAMLEEIRAVYRQTMLAFDWREGDLMMLDNLLMSHGRAPFAGPRRVLVAMA
ncbi:TauD/TfdA family dioxygenase [Paraburkholderia phosphatilytica]|uniref:TauD/TfdA family dioxygenase n=1 Tax=Paraburkholderia phosphatilytica TaxID=2282883 RepID=UPI001981688C|nr:TauD/TfdA family dioxygenase [Paraburkholderia phosphatilytica]